MILLKRSFIPLLRRISNPEWFLGGSIPPTGTNQTKKIMETKYLFKAEDSFGETVFLKMVLSLEELNKLIAKYVKEDIRFIKIVKL